LNSTGKSSNSNLDYSSSSRSADDSKQQLTDLNDPIMKSIMKFEDLNKQLSSKNLFTKIESSLHSPATPTNKAQTQKLKKSDFLVDKPNINADSANFINECLKILS